MADHGEVLAICVNWNGREVLAETLTSLLSSSYPRLRVVVVDNASTDGSADLVPRGCELVRLEENKGYGAAINWILRETAEGRRQQADYYLLLNNDVLLDPEAVTSLVKCAEERGPGIFGPKILRRDRPEVLDMAWGELTCSHVLASFKGKGATDGPQWNITREVSLLQGSVLLVSPEVIKAVGGFDEVFVMYHEEVDFELRARAKGFFCTYCPTARVWHHSAHSTRRNPSQKVFWTRRNTVYFLRKHRVGVVQWTVFFGSLFLSVLFNVASLRIGRARTIVQAVRAGFQMPVAQDAKPF